MLKPSDQALALFAARYTKSGHYLHQEFLENIKAGHCLGVTNSGDLIGTLPYDPTATFRPDCSLKLGEPVSFGPDACTLLLAGVSEQPGPYGRGFGFVQIPPESIVAVTPLGMTDDSSRFKWGVRAAEATLLGYISEEGNKFFATEAPCMTAWLASSLSVK